MSQWHWDAMRIPGSIHVDSFNRAEEVLKDLGEEIVVYCSGVSCYASKYAYKKLKEHGFTNVKHYEGGLPEWEQLGYPVEGEMAKSS
jgi:rhodanese-related sulfurtransferase